MNSFAQLILREFYTNIRDLVETARNLRGLLECVDRVGCGAVAGAR